MLKRVLMSTALVLCGSAYAQDVEPESVESLAQTPLPTPPLADETGRVVYPPEFFNRFSPSNAFDMVSRVPGFTLTEGEDRRGFSSAAGNLLIDGEPPSSKNEELEDILRRIPAAQIERIELLRGAAASGDAGGGQTTLVNVVRSPTAGAGVWDLAHEYSIRRERVSPRGSASWSGRVGDVEYALGARRFLEYRPLEGYRVLTNGAGQVTQTRLDETPRTFREAAANAEIAFPLLGGRMRANTQIQRYEISPLLNSLGYAPGGVFTDDFDVAIFERQQNFELGGNYTRDIGDAELELIALGVRRGFYDDQGTVSRNALGVETGATDQARRRDFGEYILRGVVTAPVAEGHRVQIGAEGAFNSLDARLRLSNTVGGVTTPVALAAANVLIEETRGEAFVTHLWQPSERWSIETTAAFETSTLTQSGDTRLETELSFWKPSFQITRTFGERNQARIRVYRDVGQLDFNDFVSGASVADALISGGNPNLQPETSWRIEAATDLRFGADAAFGITLFHWEVEDAADLVPVGPIGARVPAPGNIGEGTRDGVRLTGAIPLGAVIPGGRFTFNTTLQSGEVTDPVTLRPRTVTELRDTEIRAEFRQDLPEHDFAWGVRYFKQSQFEIFRLNEIETYEEGPFVDIYAESTAIPGIKLGLTLLSATNEPFRRDRMFFAPDRSGAFTGREYRERHFGSFLVFTVSGTLGG